MFNKISTKLIVMVAFTALAIIGVTAYLSIDMQQQAYINEVERHGNQLSEVIKKSMREDMLVNRQENIRNIINTIKEEPSIIQVRIFNKEGEITYSTHPEDIGQNLDKKAESCYVCHSLDQPIQRLETKDRTRIYKLNPDSSRVMGIINPIYNERSCWEAECHAHFENQTVLGVLDITISLDSIDKQIQKSEIMILLLAVISIVTLGVIIGFFVRKFVDKPVKELVEATNYVAVGKLNFEIKPRSNDELGKLAESFNNMTKKLNEMRTQLFQSDKMASLGQLAAGVAHELNNPLTGVLTYSSFLLKRTKDNPEMQEDLNVIVRETKRSREIVKSLLDFARQSAPKKIKSNVNQIIERTEKIISNQLKIKYVQLIKKLSADIPDITADPNQLQQVFINLFVNSIDAVPEGNGKISISTSLVSLSPYGIRRIKEAVCPNKHSLMDNEIKIEGLPSIKMKARSGGKEGFINLDPVYGLNRHHYQIPFTKDQHVELSCPVCDVSLMDQNSACELCGGIVYKIAIPGKGYLEGCATIGSNWQRWEYIDKKGKSDYINIEINDNGSGIPADKLDKIFDPFFSTKGQRGTGLGLSVVWGIIDNHKGRISVESNVGKGTKFKIQLPVNPAMVDE